MRRAHGQRRLAMVVPPASRCATRVCYQGDDRSDRAAHDA